MTDQPKDDKLTPKERARQFRQAAYQKQKERLAQDPRFLARKEAAKKARHDAYEQAKARRKGATAEQKRVAKGKDAADRAAKRAAADEELMSVVSPAQARREGGVVAVGSALASLLAAGGLFGARSSPSSEDIPS